MTTALTIRVARGTAAQQRALDRWLAQDAAAVAARAVIVEGGFTELAAPPEVAVTRLAAGCVCCVGLVPLRVTLTRLLQRQPPDALLLLLATDDHVERVHALVAAGALGTALQVREAEDGDG